MWLSRRLRQDVSVGPITSALETNRALDCIKVVLPPEGKQKQSLDFRKATELYNQRAVKAYIDAEASGEEMDRDRLGHVTTKAFMKAFVERLTKAHLTLQNFHGTEDERQLKTMWLTLRQRAPSDAVAPAPPVVRKKMVEGVVEPAQHKCCNAPGCCGTADPAPSAKDEKDALTKVVNKAKKAKNALTRVEVVKEMAKLLGIGAKDIKTKANTIRKRLVRAGLFKNAST